MKLKPSALPFLPENIPPELKASAQWVLWDFTPKYKSNGEKYWAKVPYQTSGVEAKVNVPETWTGFEPALSAYSQRSGKNYAGLGFVFTKLGHVQGVDLDDCVNPVTGEFNEIAKELLANIEGYAELSPSKTGLKIFTKLNLDRKFIDHSKGIEIYPVGGRYFTVTGHVIEGHEHIPTDAQDIDWFIAKHCNDSKKSPPSSLSDSFQRHQPPLDDWPLERVEQELLSRLDPSMGHDPWLQVGMALHHQFDGSPEAESLWDIWSSGGDNYAGDCSMRWKSFSTAANSGRGVVTLKTLIWMVGNLDREAALNSGQVVLNPRDYMQNAEELLKLNFTNSEGPTLLHTNGTWYQYKNICYERVEDDALNASAWIFFRKAKKHGSSGIVDFMPSPANIKGNLQALQAICHRESIHPPIWLSGSQGADSRDFVSLKNGVFHIPSQMLMNHTSDFFTVNSLPFEWDPCAQAPNWLNFLKQIWGDDPESIATLQEMMGYLLTPDTRMQKIFKIIGPKRSGKGTIGRVIEGLIGRENVCGPTLAGLTQNFGLQPLVGKLVALIADARTPQNGHSTVIERLLMISGEDLATVDRKNKDPWIGKLNTRILIMTNEPLQLEDASGALVGRMIVLKLQKSFFGQEDHTLTSKLLVELPGIFRWALEGRMRLYERGYFVMPSSSVTMVNELQVISSPITEFLNEYCQLEPNASERKDLLFEAWCLYCENSKRNPGSKATFSRQLAAAAPQVGNHRPHMNGERNRCYRGIKLKDEWRDLTHLRLTSDQTI